MRLSAVPVITDPAVHVHRDSVAGWCRSGPLGGADLEPLAEHLDLRFPESREATIEAIRSIDPDTPAIVATPPGASSEILEHLGGPRDRIVWLELEAPAERRRDARALIRGRGVNGYHWAVRSAYWRWLRPFEHITYGAEPENVGELRLPDGPGRHPLVVLMHGGYYREQWERDTIEPAAVALAERGYATWNFDYRRTGPGGDGGWPNTFLDLAGGIDHLAELANSYPIDLDRVVVAGHSAGGHFALWAGARATLEPDMPGADPAVTPCLVVSLAGVVDVVAAAERGVGFGHNPISALMGALPSDDPQRYTQVDPMQLDVAVPQVLIQGSTFDDPDLIDINRMYAAAHPEAEYIEVPGSDHFDITYPHSEHWQVLVSTLERHVPSDAA